MRRMERFLQRTELAAGPGKRHAQPSREGWDPLPSRRHYEKRSMSSTAAIHSDVDRRRLGRRGVARAFSAFIVLGLIFFLSAGTIDYGEAWVYLGLLAGGTSLAFLRLYQTDPELLERRMRLREKEPVQRRIMV